MEFNQNGPSKNAKNTTKITAAVRHCGLVVLAPAWDGTGCEFDSWQCLIYIPCSLSLRLLGFSGYIWLDTKIVLKKKIERLPFVEDFPVCPVS